MASQQGNGPRRPSPEVFRRRRIAVGIAAAVVLILLIVIITLVVRNVGKSAADASTAPPTSPITTPVQTPAVSPTSSGGTSVSGAASQSADSSASATAGDGSCDPASLTLAASTDAQSYTADQKPVLTLTVTNSGKSACKVNVGTSQMEFLIQSGSDRIFSSKDCQTSPEDLVKTLEPGKSETAKFPWQRNRSVEGCGKVDAPPGVGPSAQYTLIVKLGELTSKKAVFTLAS